MGRRGGDGEALRLGRERVDEEGEIAIGSIGTPTPVVIPNVPASRFAQPLVQFATVLQ